MLGTWVTALIGLGDVLVDRFLPGGPVSDYMNNGRLGDVAWNIAEIIIAYPIYLWINAVIGREISRRPEALESGVRKWLTYVALVMAAVVLLGDAVIFLSQFLRGDLTERFVLKSLVLVIVTGGVFWYYLGTVQAHEVSTWRGHTFAWTGTAAVAIGLVLGFMPLGTPAHQRALALDRTRIADLHDIAAVIHGRWQHAKPPGAFRLPTSLGSLATLPPSERKDPASGLPYAYRRGSGATTFQLCAVFDGAAGATRSAAFWQHPRGAHCFTFDASKSIPYEPDSPT